MRYHVILSTLESLQLFEFVTEQKVSLPILQKIKDDSCSNDDKASLFLKSISDDPILSDALKRDKEQHEKGIMCLLETSCVCLCMCACKICMFIIIV